MNVLVTGSRGQLGHDLVLRLEAMRIPCRGVDLDDFDLTDAEATERWIRSFAPTDVVHCAAFTAVDKAEDARDSCRAVNVDGTDHVARACRAVGARMVYISTDYVFSGDGEQAWDVDAPRGPRSYYGLTKSLGEDRVREQLDRYFIVRISWAFGRNGQNFVRTMLRLGGERPELTVVDDQIGSPTYTRDLAVLLVDMLRTEKYGTYHATNEGYCSWFEFACAIMEEAGLPAVVRPVPSEAYPVKAVRPRNSRLSKSSLDAAGFRRLPPWRDALRRYLAELREEGTA